MKPCDFVFQLLGLKSKLEKIQGLDCKDIGISKSEFVAITQFLLYNFCNFQITEKGPKRKKTMHCK